MNAVLILTSLGGGRQRVARLRQFCQIYQGLGACLDLALTGSIDDPGAAECLFSQVRRIGYIPRECLEGAAGLINQFLHGIGQGQPYAACHVDGLDLHWEDGAIGKWIVDTAFGGIDRPGAFDLILSPTEPERARYSDMGANALRLPFGKLPAATGYNGGMVGWSGDWPDERIEIWSEILSVLSRHGPDLPVGVLLAGSGAEKVAIPDNLANAVLVRTRVTARSSLGLAICPGPISDTDCAAINDLLQANRPVLLDQGGSAAFEGRWKLPTMGSMDHAGEMIQRWSQSPTAFDNDLLATMQSAFDDLEAMTIHVGASLARLTEHLVHTPYDRPGSTGNVGQQIDARPDHPDS